MIIATNCRSICPTCNHYHGHYQTVHKTCWMCNGSGKVQCPKWHGPWMTDNIRTFTSSTLGICGHHCCTSCCLQFCTNCNGLGYVTTSEWVPDICPIVIPWWKIFPPEPEPIIHTPKQEHFNQGLGVNKRKICG